MCYKKNPPLMVTQEGSAGKTQPPCLPSSPQSSALLLKNKIKQDSSIKKMFSKHQVKDFLCPSYSITNESGLSRAPEIGLPLPPSSFTETDTL